MLLAGTLTTAYAVSVVNGTNYQTVTIKDIPAWGHIKYNLTLGSRKTNKQQFGSFKKIRTEAALGNFAAIVDSSKKQLSNSVGLNSTPTWATEYNIPTGSVYFSAVASSGFEPSNTCDVTYYYSADPLK